MTHFWLALAAITINIVQSVGTQRIRLQNIQLEYQPSVPLSEHYQRKCNREPSGYNKPKTPGDNGFQIKVSGEPQKYVPGEVYTISLQGYRRQYSIQKFTGFMLVVEPKEVVSIFNFGNKASGNVGFFQLYGDGLSKFSDDCPHTIVQTSNIPKSEIQVMWTAPPSLSGCVVFKATITEDKDAWYMDDGGLTKDLCEDEQERKDEQPDIIEDCCACDEAKYEVSFEGLWSRHTHPKDFPSNELLPQFSDIIGSSHTADFRMWEYGGYASRGLCQLAELGTTKKLESELKTESDKIRTIVKARGLWHPNLNGKTFAVFRVDKKHHLMSLLSKLSPSPDWIVGVSALELCMKNCSWITNKVMNLYPWDAGIHDGQSYLSEISPTIPQDKIKRITSHDPSSSQSPFFDPTGFPMKPVARLIITRQRLYEKSCEETEIFTDDPEKMDRYDSQEADYLEVEDCEVTEWTDFSSCSATCGRGIQMRSRNFVNEQNARKMKCLTELTEKKHCDMKCEGNVSCKTSDWTDWTTCSVTCGIGSRSRRRYYLNHDARKVCQEELLEQRSCVESQSCEMNPKCSVIQWSEWSPCTTSCGKGIKFRTRLYLNPSESDTCNQDLMQKTTCGEDKPPCFSQLSNAKAIPIIPEVCILPKDVGPCRGLFKRWYFDTTKQACIQFVYGGCRGNKNNFRRYNDCKKICENVLKDSLHFLTPSLRYYLYKTGNTVTHLKNRVLCVPLSTLTALSTRTYDSSNKLIVDCEVSEWSEFSSCSATCGKARKERRRRIEIYPQNGGKRCPNKLVQRRKCRNNPKCGKNITP
ncbi:spondin-1-like isoform X2 [Limulus polyphemus]|uniref:Spondin-1 n=1 Tax=Limulus polyphemus TaxID=6850 RepID=A0ABM1RWX6_LIMPO|nr:spondin-1-like isoform X2 [Limulus polyphemus]